MMSVATEPPRCVCSSARPSGNSASRLTPRVYESGPHEPRTIARWARVRTARAAARAVLRRRCSRASRRRPRDGGPPVVDLGRGNPEVGPPPHVVEALREARRRGRTSTATRRSAACRACGRRSRAATATSTASRSTPSARSRSCPGRRRRSSSSRSRSPSAATRSCCRTRTTPTTRRGSRSPAPRSACCRSTPPPAGSPTSTRRRRRRRSTSTTRRTRAPSARAPGLFEAAVALRRSAPARAIVHDAAYIDLVFDGRAPESFLATPGAKEVGVELWSMSKTYGMAGWRIGFVVGNAEIVERVNLLNDHSRVGIFAPLQEAAIAALEGPAGRRRGAARDLRAPARPARRGAARAARLRGHASTSGCGCPRV